MPETTSEWLLFIVVAILARIAFTIAAFRAGERHARYKLRVQLARRLFKSLWRPVKVRNGKLVVPLSLRTARGISAAKRRKVLSAVRRDDPPANTA